MRRSYLVIQMLMASSLLLGGCTVGPDYARPQSQTPQKWSANTEGVLLTLDSKQLTRWWQQFDDPLLEQLITEAMENNLDLEIARTRLLKARAGRKLARSFSLPQLNSSSAYQRRSFSTETASPEAGLSNAGLIDRQNDQYEVGFDASFEVDLFGGNRRRNEAAMAREGAASEGIQEVQVAVLAEVGRAYMEIRGLQFEKQTVLNNISLQQETLKLTNLNRETGLATAFDIDRLQSLLDSTRAQLPAIEARIDANIFALGLLTGELPARWLETLRLSSPLLTTPTLVEAGLPPEILRRRPDIRRSERELAAASADVGIAISELYPRFFLSGIGAFQSQTTGNLLTSSAWAFAVGPMVQLPLFQGGKLRANIKDKEADLLRAELNYEKSILNALAEVDSKLAEYSSLQRALTHLFSAVEAARSAAERAKKLQRDGLGNSLDVLDAERELRNIENSYARQQTSAAITLIALYKSLGGGWEEDTSRQG